MRIFIDRCSRPALAELFPKEHEVHYMDALVESHLSDAEMLKFAAEEGYDVVVTIDRGIKFEQNTSRLPLPVIELATHGVGGQMNDFANYCHIAPYLEEALSLSNYHSMLRVSPRGIESWDAASRSLCLIRAADLTHQRTFWGHRQAVEPEQGHSY
jgi:predicted nuclease of predicted toxin-antitoxin system